MRVPRAVKAPKVRTLGEPGQLVLIGLAAVVALVLRLTLGAVALPAPVLYLVSELVTRMAGA